MGSDSGKRGCRLVVSDWLALYSAVPIVWLAVMMIEDHAHRGITTWVLGSFVVLGFFPFLAAVQFSWLFVAAPIIAAVVGLAGYLKGGFGEADVLGLIGLSFWMPIWQVFVLAVVLSIIIHAWVLHEWSVKSYPYFPSLFVAYVIAYIIGFIYVF
jgi:Flp pilus assembly protein protease CpaA